VEPRRKLQPVAPASRSGEPANPPPAARRQLADLGVRTGQFQALGDPGGPLVAARNFTVMMVDDEPVTLNVVQAFLEEAGYKNFVTTTQPAEAMSLLRERRPDVLLLDLMMPKVSGFDILEQVRADESLRFTPVIIVTADGDPAKKLRLLEMGATEILTKPVDSSELRLRVRNALAFKAYQDRLTDYDALTALPNRKRFIADVAAALTRAERSRSICALLHVDLDRFKQINDTLGHRIGDALLRAVSARLQTALVDIETTNWRRPQDPEPGLVLARISGNGFASLLTNLLSVDVASRVARNTLAALAGPFPVDGRQLYLTASIGAAFSPNDGADAETLLKNAEMAMYQAKERGRNTFEFFSEEMNARALERLSLEGQLRRALEREEFVLYYQPKVDVSVPRIVGAEALLRWKHPDLGMIPPARFIPVAEDTGLIVEIGNWVLRTASQQVRAWAQQGLPAIPVSVNVSGAQVRQRKLLEGVRRALEASGIAPSSLVVELTESMLMDAAAANVEMLARLKETGVRLSMDDFGTGYSSLTYLKRFPIDELKIDRAFISGIPAERDSMAIVTAIVGMARALGLKVVAEGVETEEQLRFLRSLRCDAYQGYYCSRPVPPEPFADLLRRSPG
jgi:diguanylate cyclase (GGDEF)-like protein